ncbi:MAG: hypothetical protein PWR13_1273 [Archaeoglobi archaeon]|nr:rhomboid family intramembrane serine protease [Candidatus Mnemosynella bozhongmuii]MDK2782245.1 hypothetical protein [Archaeoglobi archaeon]
MMISMIILLTNILFFLLQNLIPKFTWFLILYPPLLLQEPWRIITHMFIHADFSHLFFNMLFLIFFAPTLEREVGGMKFLGIYLSSGILGGVAQSLVSSSPSLGASGALYGVFGALAILNPRMKVMIFPLLIPVPISAAVVLFAFLDFILMGSGDAIAHGAHLSGLLAGVIWGFYLSRRRRVIFNGFENF